MNVNYYKQAQLILQLLPIISQEKSLALKGGTAINFFIREMPRLSIDIDLTYVLKNNREEALKDIESTIDRIKTQIKNLCRI